MYLKLVLVHPCAALLVNLPLQPSVYQTPLRARLRSPAGIALGMAEMEDPEITRKVCCSMRASRLPWHAEVRLQVKAFLTEHNFTQNALCAAVGVRCVANRLKTPLKVHKPYTHVSLQRICPFKLLQWAPPNGRTKRPREGAAGCIFGKPRLICASTWQ